MEDMFRSTAEDVLTHCAEDVALFHKHVAPGHRVSPVQPGFNINPDCLTDCYLHVFLLHPCIKQDTVDRMLKTRFPV